MEITNKNKTLYYFKDMVGFDKLDQMVVKDIADNNISYSG